MAAAATLWRPLLATAAPWNAKAFEAQAVADALQALGVTAAKESADIFLKAPEIAENGAQVPIEISTTIPNVEDIYIFVDKNPQPFAGSFRFMNGAQPFIVSRIKMAETSPVRIIVRAGDAQFITSREVKVTIGGCGE